MFIFSENNILYLHLMCNLPYNLVIISGLLTKTLCNAKHLWNYFFYGHHYSIFIVCIWVLLILTFVAINGQHFYDFFRIINLLSNCNWQFGNIKQHKAQHWKRLFLRTHLIFNICVSKYILLVQQERHATASGQVLLSSFWKYKEYSTS